MPSLIERKQIELSVEERAAAALVPIAMLCVEREAERRNSRAKPKKAEKMERYPCGWTCPNLQLANEPAYLNLANAPQNVCNREAHGRKVIIAVKNDRRTRRTRAPDNATKEKL